MARIALLPVMGWLLDHDVDQPALVDDWMFRYSPGKVATFDDFERAFATHEHFSAEELYAALREVHGVDAGTATAYRCG